MPIVGAIMQTINTYVHSLWTVLKAKNNIFN